MHLEFELDTHRSSLEMHSIEGRMMGVKEFKRGKAMYGSFLCFSLLCPVYLGSEGIPPSQLPVLPHIVTL